MTSATEALRAALPKRYRIERELCEGSNMEAAVQGRDR